MRTRLRVILLLSFSLSRIRYGVSRTATAKTKRGKKDTKGETLFVPRRNADKSVWSPRRGRRLWKSRETRERERERTWDETTDPFKSFYYSLGPTLALVVGIVCSRRCLRWWLSSREWASSPFARSLARVTFSFPAFSLARFRLAVFFTGYCLEHTFHQHPTCPLTMSDVRVSRACGCYDNTFSVWRARLSERERQVLFANVSLQ